MSKDAQMPSQGEGDAESGAEGSAGTQPAKSRFKDPELARKAAQARWSKHAARQTDPEPADEDDRTVVSTIRVAKIIRALEKKAVAGDANAGRELRAWLAEYPPQDGSVSAAQLDRRTRDRLMARLLAELEDESPAQT